MHLVVIFGPPAAGKMTVGQEVARRTGYKLFHNHMSIEPVLEIFEFGSPSFSRLVGPLRRGVIAEAVVADLPGLIFTYVWGIDEDPECRDLEALIAPVVDSGNRVDFVELVVDEDTCVAREGSENRVRHKRSKTDLDWAVAHNRELHADHVFRTDGAFPLPHPHHVVDNSGHSPDDTAAQIVSLLGLPEQRDEHRERPA